jgi:putative FmdB family regulatory protein
MPLYEYACRSCGETFEALVRGSEQPNCPKCESANLSQLLSVTAAPSGSASVGESDPGTCGRSACARGCMGMQGF